MDIGVGDKSLMNISSPLINQSSIYIYGWRMHEWMMDDEWINEWKKYE